MNRKNYLRYTIEHRILRDIYFNDRINFLDVVLGEKDALYNRFDMYYKSHGMKNPYLPGQFSVRLKCMTDGASAVVINLPAPEEKLLCHRIYAFFGKGLEKTGYFCVESHKKDKMEGPVLARWMRDGAHINYGTFLMSPEKDNSLKEAAAVSYPGMTG